MCRPPDLLPEQVSDRAARGFGGWGGEVSGFPLTVQPPTMSDAASDVTGDKQQPLTPGGNLSGLTLQQRVLLQQYHFQRQQQQQQQQQKQQQQQLQQQQEQQRVAQLAALAIQGQQQTQGVPSWSAALLQGGVQKPSVVSSPLVASPVVSSAAAADPRLSVMWGGNGGVPATGVPAAAAAVAAAAAAAGLAGPGVVGSPIMSTGVPWGMGQVVEMDGFPNGANDGLHGENEDELDEKKYKRMMSNRASAKRSRQRRQERLDELEIQSAKLRVENAAVQRRLNEAHEQIRKFQEQNESLQAEIEKLKSLMDGSRGGTSGVKLEGEDCEGGLSGQKRKMEGCGGSEDASKLRLTLDGEGNVCKRDRIDGRSDARQDHDSPTSHASGVTASSGSVESSMGGSDGHSQSQSQSREEVAEAAAGALAVGPAAQGGGADLFGPEMGSILDDELFATLIECFDSKPVCG